MGDESPALLVVDDDEDSCLMLEVALEDRGFSVRSARSCREAIDALQHERFDAMICDLTLGDGTAHDVLSAPGVRRPRVAVVLSGFDGDDDRDRSRAAGYDAHLVKPTRIDVLVDEITRGLHRPSEIRLAKVGDAREAPLQHKRR